MSRHRQFPERRFPERRFPERRFPDRRSPRPRSTSLLRGLLEVALLGTLATLSACERRSAADPSGAPLQVVDGTARLLPSGVGAAYLKVLNTGGHADRLLGAETSAARLVELHEVVRDGDVMRMEPRPDGFAVPPRGALALQPGGKHLMLLGLTVPADSTEVRVTLRFAKAGQVRVVLPVRPFAAEDP